jgi:hypothetical protein
VDEQFVGDGHEGKWLNDSELQDQSALPFRTASLELHEAARARAEVLHGPTVFRTPTGFHSSFPHHFTAMGSSRQEL